MAVAAVVDLRDTGKPMPRNVGITAFGGEFTVALTSVDFAADKVILFGPFPDENIYIRDVSVIMSADQTSAHVWDLSYGTLAGVATGALISGSTAGAGGANETDELDLTAIGTDISGSYLFLNTTTASGTPAATTMKVSGSYANYLKHNVD